MRTKPYLIFCKNQTFKWTKWKLSLIFRKLSYVLRKFLLKEKVFVKIFLLVLWRCQSSKTPLKNCISKEKCEELLKKTPMVMQLLLLLWTRIKHRWQLTTSNKHINVSFDDTSILMVCIDTVILSNDENVHF